MADYIPLTLIAVIIMLLFVIILILIVDRLHLKRMNEQLRSDIQYQRNHWKFTFSLYDALNKPKKAVEEIDGP